MKSVLDKISERSAILIVGPPMSNKKGVLYGMISKTLGKKGGIIFISTDHFPHEIESDLKKNKIGYEKFEKAGDLRFIDCYSAQSQNSLSDTKIVKKISGPLALNEISVALTDLEGDFYKRNKNFVVIFQSLSTMLIYSRPEAIERFVQIIVARAKSAGGSVYFTLEEGMHDEKTIVALKHLMDGVISVKGKKATLKMI